MSDSRLRDEAYLWDTPNIGEVERAATEAENLASLRRKVTYCLQRPQERIQFQRVEGWTTGHIIGYMRRLGLPLARIRKDLAIGRYDGT